MRHLSFPALAILLVGVACSSSISPPDNKDSGTNASVGQGDAGTFMGTLSSSGLSRTYLIHVPANVPATHAAVVIGFHGSGDNPTNFANASGLISLSDEEGFILLAPAALEGQWFLGGTFSAFQLDNNFILQLVTTIEGEYSVDPKRIYACGFSVGSTFAGMIATSSDQSPPVFDGYSFESPFAAFGLSATQNGWPDQVDIGQGSPKRPIWIIAGTADQVIPYANDQAFAAELRDGGWPVTFTSVPGAPHDWLWQSKYGHPIEVLWDFFAVNPVP